MKPFFGFRSRVLDGGGDSKKMMDDGGGSLNSNLDDVRDNRRDSALRKKIQKRGGLRLHDKFRGSWLGQGTGCVPEIDVLNGDHTRNGCRDVDVSRRMTTNLRLQRFAAESSL